MPHVGSRAHYVIKEGRHHRVFYSQWGGDDIELDLIPGPDAALRFAERQHAAEGWVDEVMCDGAALLDREERRLLWFGFCRDDSSYRAAVLRVLERTWAGWRVEWAHNGLADLLAALGEDTEQVLAPRELPVPEDLRTPEEFMAAMPGFTFNPEIYPPGSQLPATLPLGPFPIEEFTEADASGSPRLVTVRSGGEVRAYASSSGVAAIIENGLHALDTLATWTPVTRLARMPISGVHLDADARTAGVWTGRVLYQEPLRSADAWPGWKWEVWGDDYSEQLRRADGAVDVPEPDVPAALDRLGARFEEHQKGGGAAASGIMTLLTITSALRGAAANNGLEAQVNDDNAFLHRPMELTAAECAAVRAAIADCR
ncbi:hypothetical protein GCM10009799_00930 [Nocardiopsis rhodophaea]|uniref:Uncharacterized protein n=1 Tax=Nocardiopsis rhodophaea TaxID=280238 RepID=A0ABN2S4I7_9ACTN